MFQPCLDIVQAWEESNALAVSDLYELSSKHKTNNGNFDEKSWSYPHILALDAF